jgi:hypothetical protein
MLYSKKNQRAGRWQEHTIISEYLINKYFSADRCEIRAEILPKYVTS